MFGWLVGSLREGGIFFSLRERGIFLLCLSLEKQGFFIAFRAAQPHTVEHSNAQSSTAMHSHAQSMHSQCAATLKCPNIEI